MECYENLGRIGEGTYGVVLKCRHRTSRQLVAVKRFRQGEDNEQVRKTAVREVCMLKALRHENIVSLLDVMHHQSRLHLVFEYVDYSVLQALQRCPAGLGHALTRRLLWQLLQAVQRLHEHQVIHRDIKPENMLLSSSGILKLCDFGFARVMPPGSPQLAGQMSDYVATRWYRAPELLVNGAAYGPGVDIWAIGCMLVELQTGAPLFPGSSDVDQLWRSLCCLASPSFGYASAVAQCPNFASVLSVPPGQPLLWLRFCHGSVDEPPENVKRPMPHETQSLESRFPTLSPAAVELLKACLHPAPELRPSCSQLLQMPYFNGIEASLPSDFRSARAKAKAGAALSAAQLTPRQLKRKIHDIEAFGPVGHMGGFPLDPLLSQPSWQIAAAVQSGQPEPRASADMRLTDEMRRASMDLRAAESPLAQSSSPSSSPWRAATQDLQAWGSCSPMHTSSPGLEEASQGSHQGPSRPFAAQLPLLNEEPSSSAVHTVHAVHPGHSSLSLSMEPSSSRLKGLGGSGGSSAHHRGARQPLAPSKGCEKPVPGRAVARRRALKIPDMSLLGVSMGSQSGSEENASMQCSPSREASQTSAWAFPAPAQRQGMGHSPPGLPPGLPQGNAQAGGGFPYGHSPLGAAPVGLQEPQQALAASCWLQSQGLPQLGRHQLGAQQLQFRPPEVEVGCAAAVGFWGTRQPRSKPVAESAAQPAWGTHRSLREAAPETGRAAPALANGLPILGKGPSAFQVNAERVAPKTPLQAYQLRSNTGRRGLRL